MSTPAVDWLKDVPTLAVAHERLALAQEQLQQLRNEVDRLTRENTRLRARIDATPAPEFQAARGVLWQRDSTGSWEKIAYCPTCRVPLSASPPGSTETLACPKCDFVAPFRPNELADYMPSPT